MTLLKRDYWIILKYTFYFLQFKITSEFTFETKFGSRDSLIYCNWEHFLNKRPTGLNGLLDHLPEKNKLIRFVPNGHVVAVFELQVDFETAY